MSEQELQTSPRTSPKGQQVVVITGCSSGIGLTTAVHLAQDSQGRFLVYATLLRPVSQEQRFREAVAGLGIVDRTIFPVQMDVTKDDSVKRALAVVMECHGRIDILVNNAGIAAVNVSEMMTMEQAQQVFDVNFFGLFRVTKEVLPVMKKQRSGRIVNISSINGTLAMPYAGLYAASKHAVEGFSGETAIIGRFFNIYVSLVEPGPVDTPIREMVESLGLGGLDTILKNPDVEDIDKKLSKYWACEVGYHDMPMQQPVEIAEIVLEAATADRPHFRYQSCKPMEEYARRIFVDITGDSNIDYQANRLKPYLNRKDHSTD